MKVKVAYDIDFLGFVYASPKDKTGIYRVVQNVLLGLINERVNVGLYAHHHTTAAAAYVRQHPVLSQNNSRMDAYWDGEQDMKTADNIQQKKLELLKGKSLREARADFDILDRLTYGYWSLASRIFPQNGDLPQEGSTRILQESNIYHSPFSAIPDQVRQQKKLRCFLTVYDLIPILRPEYVNQQTTSWTEVAIQSLRRDDWVLAISQSTKNDLCEFREDIDPARVIVTPLAASPEVFYPCQNAETIHEVRKKCGIPEDSHYFLSLGNLAPHKNLKTVVNSFAALLNQEHIKDVVLVIVGTKAWDVDDEKIFPDILARPEVRRKIIFTGRMEDADLSALYTGSLGFVFMSLYEGFGLPPLEAMQCGVPVICSNTSSLPEVVGDAGILLDPKDEDGLCQAMLNVYNNAYLRRQMSVKSLAQAAKFSWDKCVRQTIQGYRRALE